MITRLPEQEGVEWHSDRISLPTDPDGLQDTRVSQLAAHQVVFKHTWLLNIEVDIHMEAELKHTHTHVKCANVVQKYLIVYLHIVWLNAANKKRIAPEMEELK